MIVNGGIKNDERRKNVKESTHRSGGMDGQVDRKGKKRQLKST